MPVIVTHVEVPQPGDLAHHRDGLDSRRVTRVEGLDIWLDILGTESGPCHLGNYTYTRIRPERRWQHARKGELVGTIVSESAEWLTVALTERTRTHEVGEHVTFRKTFVTEL